MGDKEDKGESGFNLDPYMFSKKLSPKFRFSPNFTLQCTEVSSEEVSECEETRAS